MKGACVWLLISNRLIAEGRHRQSEEWSSLDLHKKTRKAARRSLLHMPSVHEYFDSRNSGRGAGSSVA
jgi:hypothetical protein